MAELIFDADFIKDFKHTKTHIITAPATEQNPEGKRCEIEMAYTGIVETICPKCGSKMYSHGARRSSFTDTTFMGLPARLVLKVPRTHCVNCGHVWSPTLVSVDEKRKMTTRGIKKIASLALKRSFVDIAEEYGISKNTAKNVFVEYIREKNEQLRFKTPAFLGLDEIKIRKLGELTVITDLEHKTLYDMLQGRNQDQLTDYFFQMPDRGNVLWVCTDMYRPFRKSIQDAFPNAKWVIDHYHIVVYANRAMDAVRIHMQSKMDSDTRVKTKKGLAYTLRTRQSRLTPEDAAKIRNCRNDEKYKDLAVAYDLKEDFFDIYDKNPVSRNDAEQAFIAWEKAIPKGEQFNDFRKLAKTVRNFYEEIFNFWDCPAMITNGFTECTNRIIRENNVRGRGNSFEILRGRTLYRYTNMERLEENGMLIGPEIPAKGPVFHYEEVNGLEDAMKKTEKEEEYIIDLDDPLIGLTAGVNYDPDTGEIFDETLLEDWDIDLK